MLNKVSNVLASKNLCTIPGTSAGAHRLPVVSDLLEADALADVDQVQDVLLEARPAEAHARVQELGSNARVRADRVRHLRPQSRLQTRHMRACKPLAACMHMWRYVSVNQAQLS